MSHAFFMTRFGSPCLFASAWTWLTELMKPGGAGRLSLPRSPRRPDRSTAHFRLLVMVRLAIFRLEGCSAKFGKELYKLSKYLAHF